jgi:hypothetical protein
MAKTYHIEIARHAANVDSKWIDNLLSHFNVSGVAGGKQGTPRRITENGIAYIVLIRRLSSALGVGIGDAVSLAPKLLLQGEIVDVAIGVELRIDRALFLANIHSLVEDAAEAIVPARRGRPARLNRSAGR